MPSSRGSFKPRDQTCVCLLSLPHWQAGSLLPVPPGKCWNWLKTKPVTSMLWQHHPDLSFSGPFSLQTIKLSERVSHRKPLSAPSILGGCSREGELDRRKTHPSCTSQLLTCTPSQVVFASCSAMVASESQVLSRDYKPSPALCVTSEQKRTSSISSSH